MKKFNFRLKRVLDYRNLLKKEKERELANKTQELFTAEVKLGQIIETQDQIKLPEETHTSMAELSLFGEYQQYLQSALINQRLLVLEVTEAVEKARNAYIEKSIEAEILERLKSKKEIEFKEETQREIKKKVSDIITQRHRFSKKGNSNE